MKITVIGGGAMGTAIINGLLSDEETDTKELTITNPRLSKIEYLSPKGINICSDNIEGIKDADLIVLAVKPWIIPDVISEIRKHIDVEKS